MKDSTVADQLQDDTDGNRIGAVWLPMVPSQQDRPDLPVDEARRILTADRVTDRDIQLLHAELLLRKALQ